MKNIIKNEKVKSLPSLGVHTYCCCAIVKSSNNFQQVQNDVQNFCSSFYTSH